MSAPPRLAILVVDDDAMLRRLVVRLMRAHDVVEAENGEQALAVLDSGRVFDAILCDMEMPVMCGDVLYAHLLVKHPLAAKKMIFFSGGTLSRRTRAFLDDPSRIVVWKPFRAAKLRELISMVAART